MLSNHDCVVGTNQERSGMALMNLLSVVVSATTGGKGFLLLTQSCFHSIVNIDPSGLSGEWLPVGNCIDFL